MHDSCSCAITQSLTGLRPEHHVYRDPARVCVGVCGGARDQLPRELGGREGSWRSLKTTMKNIYKRFFNAHKIRPMHHNASNATLHAPSHTLTYPRASRALHVPPALRWEGSRTSRRTRAFSALVRGSQRVVPKGAHFANKVTLGTARTVRGAPRERSATAASTCPIRCRAIGWIQRIRRTCSSNTSSVRWVERSAWGASPPASSRKPT